MPQVINIRKQGFALAVLWIALAAQFSWILLRHFRSGASWSHLAYALIVGIAFAGLAISRERSRWLAPLLRIFIGLAFVSAILDRFGLLGGPGTPGIAWGNFRNFAAYTAQVNSFLPAAIIPALAIIETAIEATLGAAMLLGIRVRLASAGSSLLLWILGAAMTISLGIGSQFVYAVFVLAAGAWVLATLERSAAFSLDALRLRLLRKRYAQ
jgi:hypothetical protein